MKVRLSIACFGAALAVWGWHVWAVTQIVAAGAGRSKFAPEIPSDFPLVVAIDAPFGSVRLIATLLAAGVLMAVLNAVEKPGTGGQKVGRVALILAASLCGIALLAAP